MEVCVKFLSSDQQFFAFFRDITARKQADEQLRETTQLMESVIDNIPAMVFMKRADDLRFELFNRAGEELLGFTEAELLGKNDYDFFPTAEADIFVAEDRKALAADYVTEPPIESITSKHGENRYLFTRKLALRDKHGQPSHLLGISVDITSCKKMEESLRFRQFGLDHVNDAIFWINEAGQILDANQSANNQLGYNHAELCQLTIADIDPNYPTERWPKHWQELKQKKTLRFETEHKHQNGTIFPVEVLVNYFEYEGAEYNCAIVHNITERKKSEKTLQIAAATFETHEAIMVTDANGDILRVNKAFQEITGYSAEEVVGLTPGILSSGHHDKSFYTDMWQQLLNQGRWIGEIWDKRKSGEIYPKWLTITALKDSENQITEYIAIFMDISRQKKAEEEIRNLAFFDPLTKLSNRRLLLNRFNQAINASARSKQFGAIFFLDMDRFKTLNDKLGHTAGDIMLIEVAERIRLNIREMDTVARFGGDEFVVLLNDLGHKTEDATYIAAHIAEKIRAALSAPHQIKGHIHHSSSSIGVCLFCGNAVSVDDLIKYADIAMYQAKNTGRNAVRFYDPIAQQAIEARASLEVDLRQALDAQQLQLYFQVQLNPDNVPIGAEALLRWEHPKRGMVSPAQFIPIAEESSLILEIGQWVLENACLQLAQWSRHDTTRNLMLAINVSAHQFMMPNFVESIKTAVQAHNISPASLKLELTESIILNDIDNVATKMQALKAFGVGLSLDDFGTGYSSLSYLKNLPIDQVKIDQSFVRDVTSNPKDAMLVKTIIELAQNFSMHVIAEGVETDEQFEFLKKHQCMGFQGYLFSKPLPLAAFEQLIADCRLKSISSRFSG